MSFIASFSGWTRVEARLILLAASVLVLVLATIYAFLAHPALDDYCLANVHGSVLSSTLAGYRTWSGRWLAYIGFGLLFSGATFAAYWLPLLIGMALWWAGFVIAIGSKDRWFLGTLAFALMVAGMPSPAEGLFWYTDVIVYTTAFFLGAVALRSPWPVAIVAGFLIAGLNELIAGIVLVLAVAKRDWRLSLAVFLGLLLYWFSPGNAIRASYFHRASLLFTIAHTASNYDSTLAFIADPRLILFGAFLLTKERRSESLAIPLLLASLILVTFAGMTFMLGGPPPPRVLNVFYAMAIIGWTLGAQSVPWRLELPKLAQQALAIALGLSIITAPNAGGMVRDFPRALRGAHSDELLDAGGPAWANSCIAQFKHQR